MIDAGRLRVDRLGRVIVSGSVEAQRWWLFRGLLRAGGALFVDAARTAHRFQDPARHDVDIGVGARLAFTGFPGFFRADIAKGLRDGFTALSLTYVP